MALTKQQAQAIIDAHEINMDEGEETEMLEENNPDLADAYRALIAIANSPTPSRIGER